MTKQDFIFYLNAPEELNGHSIDALEKLVKEYPYFQTGRMLYLKNLHNQNSIDYEKNLHITSAYVPGGKVLYNLIRKKSQEEQQVISHQLSVIGEKPKEEAIVILKEVPIIIREKDSSLPIVAKEETGKKDEYDELHPDSYRELEKEILREAYKTSMTIDLLQEEEVKSQKHVVSEAEPSKAEQPISKSGKYSFNDWLKVVSGKSPDSAVQEMVIQKKQKSDLIDNFLLDQTAKSSSKPKMEFFSADSMAKKSIQDDETFVSETLASIYLKQGNLPKALRAYEILVVKYPEKIHIFAPLLEKIKKLLQDQRGK